MSDENITATEETNKSAEPQMFTQAEKDKEIALIIRREREKFKDYDDSEGDYTCSGKCDCNCNESQGYVGKTNQTPPAVFCRTDQVKGEWGYGGYDHGSRI